MRNKIIPSLEVDLSLLREDAEEESNHDKLIIMDETNEIPEQNQSICTTLQLLKGVGACRLKLHGSRPLLHPG